MVRVVRQTIDETWDSSRAVSYAVDAIIIIATIGLVFGLIAVPLSQMVNDPDAPKKRAFLKLAHSVAAPTEFSLGEFTFMRSAGRSSQSAGSRNSVEIVEFEAAVVSKVRDAEISHLEKLFELKRSRIRQIVDQTVRGASTDELHDPSLKIVRLRTRYRLNKLLGRRVFDDVIFSHFRQFQMPAKPN